MGAGCKRMCPSVLHRAARRLKDLDSFAVSLFIARSRFTLLRRSPLAAHRSQQALSLSLLHPPCRAQPLRAAQPLYRVVLLVSRACVEALAPSP